jgi:two-component system, chemotaxis family, response regulator Rcp1
MKSFSILVVEDSASDVRLLREALKETYLPVVLSVARDGIEATDYLRQMETGLVSPPDLVLLDLNLPRKNGLEVLTEVKTSPNLKQIPVIVMTNSSAERDIKEAYSRNANCYITKPRDLSDLIAVLRGIGDFWFGTATLPNNFHVPFAPLVSSLNYA